ncbi:hypothetical protein Q5752_002239 [Cryptotrichosporon argae]
MTDVLADSDAMQIDCHVERSPSPADAPADLVAEFLQRLLADQCRYIGIYSPGDYGESTYRVVIPAPGHGRGRGFRRVREEVVLETEDRRDIDKLVAAIVALPDSTDGLVAVRHIVNPSTCADEGMRLIWARDGPAGRAEMADWPRRDRMLRAGRTVRAASDDGAGATGGAERPAAFGASDQAGGLEGGGGQHALPGGIAINPAVFGELVRAEHLHGHVAVDATSVD